MPASAYSSHGTIGHMCGRYSLQSDPAQLAVDLEALDLASQPAPGAVPAEGPRAPRFNIAPTTTIPVLTAGGENRELLAMRWGLVPSWTKDPGDLPNLFNARSETAATKPSFRSAVRRRHAVVPMDGWYEWVPEPAREEGGKKGPKQPFFMSLPGDSGLHMAALWERWTMPDDDDGEPDLFAHAESGDAEPAAERVMYSCTILTTEALGPLRAVHHRMPLVVPPEKLDAWLDPGVITDPLDLVDTDELTAWAETIEIRPVSRAVSNVRNDRPELLEPVPGPEWFDAG